MFLPLTRQAYLPFGAGLADAATTRHVRRDWAAWAQDWSWMSSYFSVAVWSSILLVNAPRVTHAGTNCDASQSHEVVWL